MEIGSGVLGINQIEKNKASLDVFQRFLLFRQVTGEDAELVRSMPQLRSFIFLARAAADFFALRVTGLGKVFGMTFR